MMRKITSIILALAFIIVSVTGVQMALPRDGQGHGKPPVIQSQSNDTGVVASAPAAYQPSFYPKVAHEWGGYLFIIAGIVHLVLNIKPMQSYLRIRR